MSQPGDYFFCGVGGSGMTPRFDHPIQGRTGEVLTGLDQGRNTKRFIFSAGTRCAASSQDGSGVTGQSDPGDVHRCGGDGRRCGPRAVSVRCHHARTASRRTLQLSSLGGRCRRHERQVHHGRHARLDAPRRKRSDDHERRGRRTSLMRVTFASARIGEGKVLSVSWTRATARLRFSSPASQS